MRCGLVGSFGIMLGESSRVLPRTSAKTRSTRNNWQGKQSIGETMSKTAKLCKAACSLNLAVLLRAVRCGPGDAVRKAVRAYDLINPQAREKGRDPWDDPRVNPRVWNLLANFPRIGLSDVIAARRFIIIDGSLAYADGSLGIQDQAALMSLVCDREPDMVLEIGTYNGATTRLIALNLPDAKVHTLDLPAEISDEEIERSELPKDDFHLIASRRVGEAFLSDPAVTNVTQHFGDSATRDFSPGQGLEFAFIDDTPVPANHDGVDSDHELHAIVYRVAPSARALSGPFSSVGYKSAPQSRPSS